MVCVIALSATFVEDIGGARPGAEPAPRRPHVGVDQCVSALPKEMQRNPGLGVLRGMINSTQNFKNTPFHSRNDGSYLPESLLALAPKQPLTTFANLIAVK